MGELHRLVVASVTKRASALQAGFTLGKLAQEMDRNAFLQRLMSELPKTARKRADAAPLAVLGKLRGLNQQLSTGEITVDQLLEEISRDYDLGKSDFITANLDRIRAELNAAAPAPTATAPTATAPTATASGNIRETVYGQGEHRELLQRWHDHPEPRAYRREELELVYRGLTPQRGRHPAVTSELNSIERELARMGATPETPATAPAAAETTPATTPATPAAAETATASAAAEVTRPVPPPATPIRARDAGSYSAHEIADASHPEISLMFDQFGNQYSVDRTYGEAFRRVSRPDGAVSWHRTPGLDFQVENGKLRPTQQTQRMGLSAANVGNVAAQLGENAFYDPRSGRYFRKDDTGNATPVSSAEVWAIQNPGEAAHRQAAAERMRARSRDPQALASQARAYQAAGAPLPPSLATAIQDLTSDDYSTYAARLRGLHTEPDRRRALDEQMAAHDQSGVRRLQAQSDMLRKDRVVPDPGASDQRLPAASRLPGAYPATRGVGASRQRPNVAPQGVSITPPTRLTFGAPPSTGAKQAS